MMKNDEADIRVEGIVPERITLPRMDGSPGCALYKVPIRLSREPDHNWAALFVQNWDNPPKWTSMHRPGIARVQGDVIVLDGTTLEEIEKYHRDTLKLAVAETNRQHKEIQAQQLAKEEGRRTKEAQLREEIDRKARTIKFD